MQRTLGAVFHELAARPEPVEGHPPPAVLEMFPTAIMLRRPLASTRP